MTKMHIKWTALLLLGAMISGCSFIMPPSKSKMMDAMSEESPIFEVQKLDLVDYKTMYTGLSKNRTQYNVTLNIEGVFTESFLDLNFRHQLYLIEYMPKNLRHLVEGDGFKKGDKVKVEGIKDAFWVLEDGRYGSIKGHGHTAPFLDSARTMSRLSYSTGPGIGASREETEEWLQKLAQLEMELRKRRQERDSQ